MAQFISKILNGFDACGKATIQRAIYECLDADNMQHIVRILYETYLSGDENQINQAIQAELDKE